jgi:glyoxylase-like metal-dependent hydrolase (beta-lactamase superfamily II)
MLRLVLALVSLAWLAPGARAEDVAQERVSELLTRGSELRAVPVAPDVWLVSGNSNAYLVTTPEGGVLIDTGLGPQAARTRELLRAEAPDLKLRAIVLTHAHADHTGGLSLWNRDGVAVRQPARNSGQ